MKVSLEGKIAVVTGGSSGIGEEICTIFAQVGATVHFLGTSEAGYQVLKDLKKISNLPHAYHRVNISSFEEVQELFASILKKSGQIDILVNNAGITKDNLLLKMSEQDWDDVIGVNLKGCFNTCKASCRSFIRRRSGSIINISSVVALNGNPGQLNYAAAKGGMTSFSKSLAKELAPRGIRVNVIAPGFTETRMTNGFPEDQKKQILSTIPFNRMGHPKEIANCVLFLASDLSSYITGEVIRVDGGLAM